MVIAKGFYSIQEQERDAWYAGGGGGGSGGEYTVEDADLEDGDELCDVHGGPSSVEAQPDLRCAASFVGIKFDSISVFFYLTVDVQC